MNRFLKEVLLVLLVSGLTVLGQVMLPHRHSISTGIVGETDTNTFGTLVGYWPLDETTGQRRDYSGYNNHFQPSNTVNYVSAAITNGTSLPSGAFGFLNIPSTASLVFDYDSFAIMGWFRLHSLAANQPMLTKDNFTTSDRDFDVLYNQGDNRYAFYIYQDDGTQIEVYPGRNVTGGSRTPYTNLWTQICCYWNTNSGAAIMCLNGLQVGFVLTTNIITQSSADLRLGATADNLSFTYGDFDHWRLWHTVGGITGGTGVVTTLFFQDQLRELTSTSTLASQRTKLITKFFGASTLPDEVGTLSATNSPVVVTNYDSVDVITMASYASRPRIWYATGGLTNTAIILHQGHTGTYGDYQYDQALQLYLNYRLPVCGLVMPGGDDITSGTSASHNAGTNTLDAFVGPVIVAINTLETAGYTNIYMTGLSGGGWSTVLASAMDTRITKSYPTCGSLPEYCPSSRDWEQFLYERGVGMSYLQLYVMGASPARRQLQINYTTDACCFNLANAGYGANFVPTVTTLATNLGAGNYELSWQAYTTHQFEPAVIQDIILPDILGNQTLLGGLTAYWRMDETSGTRTDEVASNDLSQTNNVGYAAGVITNTAYFQSASVQYLGIPSSAAMSMGDYDFSIAGWVKLISKTGQRTIMSQYDAADSKRSFFLLYDNTANRFQFIVSSNGVGAVTLSANNLGIPATNTWYFIYAYHDAAANQIGISINNGSANTTAYTMGVYTADTPLCVGANYNGGSGMGAAMDGYIDELGLWKRRLSTRELGILYNSGAGRSYPFN